MIGTPCYPAFPIKSNVDEEEPAPPTVCVVIPTLFSVFGHMLLMRLPVSGGDFFRGHSRFYGERIWVGGPAPEIEREDGGR